MSRSEYDSDNYEQYGLWRGAVEAAVRGKRGQAFLKEMLAALDAMPVKELFSEVLVSEGCVCAMGAVAVARQVPDIESLDPEDHETVAKVLGIANALTREIAYLNDEAGLETESPSKRWTRMRKWVAEQIRGDL